MNALSRRGALVCTLGLSLATTAASASPQPDAELIAACAEFVRLELLARAILNGAHSIEEEKRADKEADAVWDLQGSPMEVMCSATPRTALGALAVYQAAMFWLDDDPEDDPERAKDTRLRAAAHRAVLAGLGV